MQSAICLINVRIGRKCNVVLLHCKADFLTLLKNSVVQEPDGAAIQLWSIYNEPDSKEHFTTALKINPQLQAPRMYLDALTRQNN